MVNNADKRRLVVITNIVAPYRVATFRELARLVDLHVLFSASTESHREWSVVTELPFAATVIGGSALKRRRPEPIYHSPQLLRHLSRLRPHVVMVGGYSVPALYAAIYCQLHATKFIEFSDGTPWSERSLGRLSRLGRVMVARVADAAVGPSTAALERFNEIGISPSKCFRAPYALDVRDRPTRTFPDDANTRLLFVGRLVPGKGLAELLREIAMVDDPGLRLTLVGSGPEQVSLERLSRDLGLEDRVHFAGFVDQPDLPALYARHDVFVFPTLGDTFGIVTLEAMAAGLPVVASLRAGSTPDFVSEGRAGWTCDPFSSGSIANAIRRALDARPDWARIGRHNRELASATSPAFSAERMVAAVDEALASHP